MSRLVFGGKVPEFPGRNETKTLVEDEGQRIFVSGDDGMGARVQGDRDHMVVIRVAAHRALKGLGFHQCEVAPLEGRRFQGIFFGPAEFSA